MNSVRSAKAYYIAAFILGALIALLVVSPGRSAELAPTIALGSGETIEFSGVLQ